MVDIYTYNDLLDIGENEKQRMEFVLSAIREHKGSANYKMAVTAERYFKRDTDIVRYVKMVTNHLGQKVPDIWSANAKISTGWYKYFTTQKISYLLGNGVTFGKPETEKKLGKGFLKKLKEVAKAACNGGVGFGYWNNDRLMVFSLTEFVPLQDEDDGFIKAGIRFWQIDDSKPMRFTLYEMDGFTEYIKRKDQEPQVFVEKTPYKKTTVSNKAEGEISSTSENYPGFPIVPLWNIDQQSDLKGNKETIDNYELMISKLVNTADEGEITYWVLKGLGALDDTMSLVQFKEQMKFVGAANLGDNEGTAAEPHTVEPPFAATSEAIDRLTAQLYHDFMALNVETISSVNVTATKILAAYEPINQKTDEFEDCVTEFIQKILELVGIDDEPTYTRSQMSNMTEIAEIVFQASDIVDDEYATTKILTLLGDADKAQEVLKRKDAEAADRYKQQEAELEELRNQEMNNDADTE